MNSTISSITARDSTFSDNSATYGAGIYFSRAKGTIFNSAFNDNTASFFGASLYGASNANVTVDGCEFLNNNGFFGGSFLSVTSTFNIINSYFNNSVVQSQGGVFFCNWINNHC